jgi:hypothetical protein
MFLPPSSAVFVEESRLSVTQFEFSDHSLNFADPTYLLSFDMFLNFLGIYTWSDCGSILLSGCWQHHLLGSGVQFSQETFFHETLSRKNST